VKLILTNVDKTMQHLQNPRRSARCSAQVENTQHLRGRRVRQGAEDQYIQDKHGWVVVVKRKERVQGGAHPGICSNVSQDNRLLRLQPDEPELMLWKMSQNPAPFRIALTRSR
jgi:hypothetical protein